MGKSLDRLIAEFQPLQSVLEPCVNGAMNQKKKGVARCDRDVLMPFECWRQIAAHCQIHENYLTIMRTMGLWGLTRSVYRFDEDLTEALRDSDLPDPIPADVLRRLPEHCMFIETPGLKFYDIPTEGFFVFTDEWDVDLFNQAYGYKNSILDDFQPQLVIVPVVEEKHKITPEEKKITSANDGSAYIHWCFCSYPLVRSHSIESVNEALARNVAAHSQQPYDPKKQYEPETEYLKAVIPMILYLCSQNPDVCSPKDPAWKPHRVRPVKRGGLLKYVYPKKTRFVDVGSRVGQVLSAQKDASKRYGSVFPSENWSSPRWNKIMDGPAECYDSRVQLDFKPSEFNKLKALDIPLPKGGFLK